MLMQVKAPNMIQLKRFSDACRKFQKVSTQMDTQKFFSRKLVENFRLKNVKSMWFDYKQEILTHDLDCACTDLNNAISGSVWYQWYRSHVDSSTTLTAEASLSLRESGKEKIRFIIYWMMWNSINQLMTQKSSCWRFLAICYCLQIKFIVNEILSYNLQVSLFP